MADVSTPHPQLVAATSAWQKCRDVGAGERAVKARGSVHLPRPAGMSREDYQGGYLLRAVLFAAFIRTVVALSGAMFTRPLTVNGVPDSVRSHLDDLTFSNETLTDVALTVATELLTVGRAGLLLDMAPEGGRPYWCVKSAEDIVNWRTSKVGEDPDTLVQLVLRENRTVPDASGFGHKTVAHYRELALMDGIYRVRVWSPSDPSLVQSTSATPFLAGDWMTPSRRGVPLNFIPFTFIGPHGVTPTVAKPPLEDLADLVLAHFRNSADHEHGLYLTALPTPWAAGLAGTNQVLKIGPSVCWHLEKDGKAGLLEFTGAGLAAIREAMSAKERQMAVLGGRLLLDASSDGRQNETATSARLRYSAEAASLRTIAGAIGTALTRMLRWHVWWMTTGEIRADVSATLGEEFFNLKATPEEVKAALLLYQSDSISFETFFDQLQKGGWTRLNCFGDHFLGSFATSKRRQFF